MKINDTKKKPRFTENVNLDKILFVFHIKYALNNNHVKHWAKTVLMLNQELAESFGYVAFFFLETIHDSL